MSLKRAINTRLQKQMDSENQCAVNGHEWSEKNPGVCVKCGAGRKMSMKTPKELRHFGT